MNKKLIEEIKGQFKLDINSEHGLPHWERVNKIGLFLAQKIPSDTKVITLFAYLHDSQRLHEYEDFFHGERAARYAEDLYNRNLLDIDEEQLAQLKFACKNHSDNEAVTHDPTIQICWDADKLDLSRIGEEANDKYLLTDFAKTKEAKSYAKKLSTPEA